MTNSERKSQIKSLGDLIYPLNEEKLLKSLRYNFLSNSADPLDEPSLKELQGLKTEIEKINKELSPLLKTLAELQIKYVVEFDAEVLEGGMLKTEFIKKILSMPILVDIDTYTNAPDWEKADVAELALLINNYIYDHESSQFTIRHIKRIV